MNNTTSGNELKTDPPTEPTRPTRDQIRAHNRGARLDKGWANKCPARPFTSAGGLKRHIADYHRVNVEIKVRP
jgi:hypothetical protein